MKIRICLLLLIIISGCKDTSATSESTSSGPQTTVIPPDETTAPAVDTAAVEHLPDENGVELDPEYITMSSVAVYNSGSKPLSFKFGISATEMAPVTVQSQEKWVSTVIPAGIQPFASVRTAKYKANYRLKSGNTYEIFFNRNTKHYELQRIETE